MFFVAAHGSVHGDRLLPFGGFGVPHSGAAAVEDAGSRCEGRERVGAPRRSSPRWTVREAWTQRPSLIMRFATPDEVAAMVAYVCSGGQASATTGAALRVDGGVVRAILL
jgi:NAD(P)-dependent dehydrogenase (short-subunit alcohol dehydrogenase family)